MGLVNVVSFPLAHARDQFLMQSSSPVTLVFKKLFQIEWKEDGKYIMCFLVYLGLYRGSSIMDFILHPYAKSCANVVWFDRGS